MPEKGGASPFRWRVGPNSTPVLVDEIFDLGISETIWEEGGSGGIEAEGLVAVEFGKDWIKIDEPAFEQGPRRLL